VQQPYAHTQLLLGLFSPSLYYCPAVFFQATKAMEEEKISLQQKLEEREAQLKEFECALTKR